jgi:diguanylate cyclase (GGDEF)-like protein
MKVLIAEDDSTSLLILRKAIENLGHECVIAGDGDAAWEQYLEVLPDVVITDRMMPGIDGSEVVRRIREQPRYCYVVMLTALSGDEHELAGMSAGADGYLAKPLDIAQLRFALIAAQRMTTVHRELADRESELEAANARLSDESRRDGLTGLGNRLRMREDLVRLDDSHRRYGHPYALALVDVDRFKAYNDRYGHLAGDEALRAVADALNGGLRSADFVYRYGGEELLVVLPEQTLDDSRLVVERLRQAVADAGIPHEDNSPFGVLTVSAGIAAATAHSGADAQVVLLAADKALYDAKSSGRNRVSTGTPALVSQAQ